MNTMQWQQLAARAADGTLSQEEGAQLLVLCRESHEAREALTKVMAVERLLPLALGDPRGTLAAKEVVLRLEEGSEENNNQSIEIAWRAAEQARSWLWGKRLRKLGAIAASLTLLGSAVWLAVENNRPAVSYSRSEALTWAGTPPSTRSEGLARGTRLEASAGLLELGFSSGARMILEAPFDVELRDGLTAYLHSGRVTVRCPSSAHGFTVLTPYGKVVDRGTEFCVDLNRKTKKMEVHVLEGMVEAIVPKQSPVSLFAGDALRISGQNTKRLQANEGAFITALPNASEEPTHYVHWSFDEAGGWVADNRGKALGRTEDTKLYMRGHPNPDAPGAGTQWLRGPFGHAMSFDGRTGYAETPFPGIAGNVARTVALWVRVPKSFDINQGHGIVSWGTLQTGGAWQLSANCISEDGPIGRLRVGTYQTGAMVGTTDLREVDTDVANAHHGVWIGRNVAYPLFPKTANPVSKFFRGEVDEVYIFDSALSHQNIVRLMKENEPPP